MVDSSDDGTEKIIGDYKKQSRFPFNVIYQKPQGVGVARNTGIESANGEVLIFVDADCWIDEDFVEKAVRPFSEADEVLSVYVKKIQSVQSDRLFPELVDLYERVIHYDAGVSVRIGLIVVRKTLYDHIGLYDRNLKSGEDDELFNRLIKKRDELVKTGYKFDVADSALIYEEKQGLRFFEYYKRCMWYGEPLANWKYFSHKPAVNASKILIGLYTVILPVLLIFSIASYSLLQIFIELAPLAGFTIYFVYKSVVIGTLSRRVFFVPFFFYYKFLWLFIGFVKKLLL